MILRDYQNKAVDSILGEWEEQPSTLLDLATGLGKTVVFSEVINRYRLGRAMVLAHREELIFQARDKIQRVTGLRSDIEMGEYLSSIAGNAPVIVSSIQTQTAGGDGAGRMAKFDPTAFGLLIIDECHHATASSYRRVIDYYRSNPALKVLGVTATPDRSDEEALGQIFATVAMSFGINDGIEAGWLTPIDQRMVNVAGLDFSSVRTTAGDLNNADLAALMEAERNLHEIAGSSIDIIGQKRALVFAASVLHAQTLCEIFNRHRNGMAAWVCGKTDRDERRDILASFAKGETQVVCNCGVLTEGFDDPGIEVVIMGRPTKSRSLYAQMVGRSTRPLPGLVDGVDTPEGRRAAIAASSKPSCVILDFCGNSGKHKLITSADILGGKYSEQAVERAISRAREGKPVRMDEALKEEEEAIRREQKLIEEGRRAKLVAKAQYSMQRVDPFDVFQIEPVQPRGWDAGKTLTEKQRNIITKAGIDPDTLPYSQAKQLIGEIMNRWDNHLATFKQAKWLKSHGYSPNMPITEASKVMDSWAKNGWKRPSPPSIPMPTQPPVMAEAEPF